MKINASITILFREGGLHIEVEDRDASITFLELDLDAAQTCQALSRLGCTPVSACEVEGLDRVGKKMEHKKLEFEVPKGTRWTHRKDSDQKLLKLMHKHMPEGWVSDAYFQSQDSFFERDGKEWAQTTIRRWV